MLWAARGTLIGGVSAEGATEICFRSAFSMLKFCAGAQAGRSPTDRLARPVLMIQGENT